MLKWETFSPRLGQFMIDGSVARGIGISTHFGWLKFNYIQGEINRKVDKQNRINGVYTINHSFYYAK